MTDSSAAKTNKKKKKKKVTISDDGLIDEIVVQNLTARKLTFSCLLKINPVIFEKNHVILQ